MNFQQALRDLDSRQPEQMPEPSLDRIWALAELLDHPELTYPSIHVTGTNGKTTTARLVTALACAHGLTTGTFLSPHLHSVTERLTICGDEISISEFGEEYERLLPYLRETDERSGRLTYFEALTGLAYVWFADKPVQLGVFEVGMGGTWDATNLVRGDVAVIAPIGLDHVQQLGRTIPAIATEKAGVIKEGRVAVVRAQRPEAMEVIRARAAEVGATLLIEGTDFGLKDRSNAVGGQLVTVEATRATYEEFFLPLHGEESGRNAAAAVVAVEALLGRHLDDDAVASALGSVTSPGRMEVAGRHPLVVLDGAHNPDAARALANALLESFRWERLHLVTAMFEDKAVEEVAEVLAPLVDRAYAARNQSPRSAPAERVAEALRASGVEDVRTFGDVRSAVEAARAAATEGDLILVTGSFYTVGDARPLFFDRPEVTP
jgi:dihydrofolate synthase/folylpolyglutamate synthase